jgi:hypothetical protein
MVEGYKAISIAHAYSCYMFVIVTLLYVSLGVIIYLRVSQNKEVLSKYHTTHTVRVIVIAVIMFKTLLHFYQ